MRYKGVSLLKSVIVHHDQLEPPEGRISFFLHVFHHSVEQGPKSEILAFGGFRALYSDYEDRSWISCGAVGGVHE